MGLLCLLAGPPVAAGAQQPTGDGAAFLLAPVLSHAAVRDERISPLRYSGLEWGAQLRYTSSLLSTGWHLGAQVTRGTLDRGGTRSPEESSTSFWVRGGYQRAFEGADGVRVGLEGALAGGVRVHRFEGVDAGYAEALLSVGPTFEYGGAVGEGDLRGGVSVAIASLMVRPYADVGVARAGDVIARMRLADDLFVARAGVRYGRGMAGRWAVIFGYDLAAQRIRDDDHFGRIAHALIVSVVRRRGG